MNTLVPAATGVPEIAPEEASVKPAGRLPETIDHVYGAVSPEAVNVAVYVEFCVPAGNDDVVTFSGARGSAPLNVATTADQVVAGWRRNTPANDPVELVILVAFTAREPLGLFSPKV